MKYLIGIFIAIFILSCIHKDQNDNDNMKQSTIKFIELDTITNGIHTVIVGSTDSLCTEDTALTLAGLYYNPYLIIDNVPYKIKDYEQYCATGGLWELSPDGKVLLMIAVRVRRRATEENFSRESQHCFAIDVENKGVICEIYGDYYSGEWDEHGNLVYNNQIYFSPAWKN